MLSYLNDPAVKAKYTARFEAHRKADEVIQGTGFDNGRGCFVGCTLDAYEHDRFPIELGWPEWLALLADAIFEGVPKTDAAQFGTDLLEAVPVGVDLEPVRSRFLLTVQRRNLARMVDNTDPAAPQVRAAIQTVIDLLESDEPARSAAWSAAESAAESAARSAAWSAARSAAWSAARSAARSAAWSAAWSVAWSVAESAAESAEYKTMRDDLLAICRELETV
ncbi:MAG: hypothetical protein V4451_16200 [Pseudomonadota bacterium]